MPTSHPKIISPVIAAVLAERPRSVLDIGVGFGKWGALVREYTDIWDWRFYRNEWLVEITGIEVFEKYRSFNWSAYNRVIIGDVCNTLPTLGSFDVIMMLEVLEHVEKEKALPLLQELMQHTKKLFVSYTNTDQHDVRDNKHEDHVSKWSIEEIRSLGLGAVTVLFEDSDGAVLLVKSV